MDPLTQPELPLEVGVAHCCFCSHTETFDLAVGRSSAMESHYVSDHAALITQAVGAAVPRSKK